MTTSLRQRTDDACDQLTRYGGVYNEELADALEELTNINDDLCNDRDTAFNKIRDLLDILEATL